MIKRLIAVCLTLVVGLSAYSQEEPTDENKKYQSLLWEITGPKLEKPSYLYGTMHVSSKLAFYLGDSFFNAIKSADVVGLETTPDTWLDEMIAYDQFSSIMSLVDEGNGSNRRYRGGNDGFAKDLTYAMELSDIKDVAGMLRSDPRLINSFMFRKTVSQDNFEEDTYLDLYIFRVGKKLKKQVIGVEDFAESQALVEIAYKYSYDKDDVIDGYKDVEVENYYTFYEKFEDAYRKGDLDLLDSLNKVSNPSRKYNKYMLWIRNANMVNTMDSIMPNKSMFVGVGAAHLPGEEGVIELLRKQGYTVRPIKFTGRAQKEKDRIDEIFIDHSFQPYKSADGLIELDAPGKFTEFPFYQGSQQSILTDMVNSNYFVITRLAHHSSWFGQDEEYVLERVDSLLFENVPGKILEKERIKNNGFIGIDVKNETRRGDHQRYQIFVTPHEIIVIKLGGSKEYATSRDARKFFKSIKLNRRDKGWKTYTPPYGAFSAELPNEPWSDINRTPIKTGFYDRRDFVSNDNETGNAYFIFSKMNYASNVIDEDSFELRLAIRSFSQGDDLEIKSQKYTTINGRLGIEAELEDKDENSIRIRTVMRGPRHFVYGVRIGKDKEGAERFLNSFKFTDYKYQPFKTIVDSTFYYKVDATTNINSPLEKLKKQLNEDADKTTKFEGENQRLFVISPNTSEVVFASYAKPNRYRHYKDSASFWRGAFSYLNKDSTMICRELGQDSGKYWHQKTYYFTDTATTRALLTREYIAHGKSYSMIAIVDSVDGPTPFIQRVFDSFEPFDEPLGESVFENKVDLFFMDIASEDSTTRAEALDKINRVYFKDEDAHKLIDLLDTCKLCEDYEEKIVKEISYLENEAVMPFLEKRLVEAGDTASLQVKTLSMMLGQDTKAAYDRVKEFIMEETPLPSSSYVLNSMFNAMDDSLELATTFFPDFLSIIFLQEYRSNVYELLATLNDSARIKSQDYDAYRKQIMIMARNNIKRLATSKKSYSNSSTTNELRSQLHLLIPYYAEPKVQELYKKAFKIDIPTLKIDLAFLMFERLGEMPDSIVTALCKDLDTRAYMYGILEHFDKLNKFPKKYRGQDSLALSMAKIAVESSYGSNSDSIQFISKQKVTQWYKEGYIYVYRVKSNYGENWKFVTVGLMPEDGKSIFLFGGLTELWSYPWKKTKDEDEQVAELLDNILIDKRKKIDDLMALGGTYARYLFTKKELSHYYRYNFNSYR